MINFLETATYTHTCIKKEKKKCFSKKIYCRVWYLHFSTCYYTQNKSMLNVSEMTYRYIDKRKIKMIIKGRRLVYITQCIEEFAIYYLSSVNQHLLSTLYLSTRFITCDLLWVTVHHLPPTSIIYHIYNLPSIYNLPYII